MSISPSPVVVAAEAAGPASPPPRPPLPRRTKFVYGLGDWGTSAATAARSLYWLFFLVSVVGLEAELAGSIILVGRIWDSINDPLIGILSDRLDSRWGRRRPFLLFGAVPFGLAFFLLFFVPPLRSELALAIYYGVTYLLFDTMYTVINVPYAALTAELTEEYDERSSLAGWRMATAILASLVAATTFKYVAENVIGEWLAVQLGVQAAIRLGYAVAAGLLAFTLVIPPLILFKVIREPDRAPATRQAPNLLQTFREVFSSRSFRIVSIVYLLSFGTVDIVVSVLVWFLVYYVRVERGFDSLVLGVVMGLGFATIPLTVRLMQRYGKRTTYMAAMSVFAVVLLILSQVPPGGQIYVLAAAAFAGLGYGAANVIPWAMVADIAEEDELRFGQRREGVYAGYLVFFRKLATAFSLFLVTRVLAWTDFRTSTTGGLIFVEQPPMALFALRFLVGVLPALMLVLSILVISRYPLDKAAHDAIRQELAARRAARPAEASPEP